MSWMAYKKSDGSSSMKRGAGEKMRSRSTIAESISSEVTEYFCLDHSRPIGIQINPVPGGMQGVR